MEGGLCNAFSSVRLMNCSLSGNSAGKRGGGIGNSFASLRLRNCILWHTGEALYGEGEYSVMYSCIEGGGYGKNNIVEDPLFVDVQAGDLRLDAASPCIDQGTAVEVPQRDILGRVRPQGAGVDIGAYEYTASSVEGEAEGEVMWTVHRGDYEAPWGAISLSELLRFVQFYNARGYHCAEAGELSDEGYIPFTAALHECPAHTGDFNGGADWQIDLTELLRLIQFYNARAYHPCDDPRSDEGYCPGAAPTLLSAS